MTEQEVKATCEEIAQWVDAMPEDIRLERDQRSPEYLQSLCERLAGGPCRPQLDRLSDHWRLLLWHPESNEHLVTGFAYLRKKDGVLELWTISEPKATGTKYEIANRLNREWAEPQLAVSR